MTAEQLTPESAVRLLRAKVSELETVAGERIPTATDAYGVAYLAADIALVAALLADHIERIEAP